MPALNGPYVIAWSKRSTYRTLPEARLALYKLAIKLSGEDPSSLTHLLRANFTAKQCVRKFGDETVRTYHKFAE